MKKIQFTHILFLFASFSTISASNLFIEAESFTKKSGWVVDQQFMDLMGSSYLMAHGMGEPVEDAKTEVTFPEKGTYYVYIRTYTVDQYPAVTETSQEKLRTILRTERRMEFPKEGLRYMDLMRWKLIDKVMSKKVYMMLYPSSLLIEKVVNEGDWFWPFAPDIDENGLADFTKMEAAGKIAVVATKNWDERQYLWPIPTTEIQINPNMKQNPGY